MRLLTGLDHPRNQFEQPRVLALIQHADANLPHQHYLFEHRVEEQNSNGAGPKQKLPRHRVAKAAAEKLVPEPQTVDAQEGI